MQRNSNKFMEIYKKYNILLLTILIGIVGSLIFVFIYGIHVLNFNNDNWIMANGRDLFQHHIGFHFFRNSAWYFPIGLFNTLSYPNYASIIFTDSIPLLAVFCKIISPILPVNFQYLGVFGLFCYILQGIYAFTLLRKFIENKFYAFVGSIFFIISPYILQRMFIHTALAANFLILMAFSLWAYREIYTNKPVKKIFMWSMLLILATTIHLYYFPMIMLIMICTFIQEFIENRKTLQISIITIVIAYMCVIFLIYILGGFGYTESYSLLGANEFNINLNTLFNPQGYSSIIPNLNTATNGEYEGLGYLGFGMLLMCFLSVVLLVKNIHTENKIHLKQNSNATFITLCILGGVILALGTSIKLGKFVLFDIPYPNFILCIFYIFRATGRFIWIVDYLIFFIAIYIVYKYLKRKTANIIIVLCLVIQVLDLYPSMAHKFEYIDIYNIQNQNEWDLVLKDCKHIICFGFSDISIEGFEEIIYLAKEKNLSINKFYFARHIKNTTQTEGMYLNKLINNEISQDDIYIVRTKNAKIFENTKLNLYKINDYIIAVPNKIEELEEIIIDNYIM